MIYNAGTISFSGNSVTGTGTNFTAPTSQIRLGQTLIVASNPVQLVQITAINSATSLTVTPAASPAVSGQRYGILVTDSLSVDGLAQSISQLINEYDENIGAWEAFATTSANQNVNVTINGVSLTIPAIGKLLQKGSNGALPVNQGGTGATKAEDARTSLGLGSAATKNIVSGPNDTTAGAVLTMGYHGLGVATLGGGGGDTDPLYLNLNGSGFYTVNGDVSLPAWWHPAASNVWGGGIYISRTSTQVLELLISRDGKAGIRARRSADASTVQAEFYTTLNTTKSSDGTLKAASPVARIVKSRDETQRADITEDGFAWCGCGAANDEAEGINISRLDVGVYVLTGSAGLASSGWQLLPPMDPAGMGEMGVVEAEQTESGGLTIRLFRRKYQLTEDGEMVKTKGEPMDVPTNSWIDVRLEMPQNSIWNQKQAEVTETLSAEN